MPEHHDDDKRAPATIEPKRKNREPHACKCDPMLAGVPIDPVVAQDPNRRCSVCGGVRP